MTRTIKLPERTVIWTIKALDVATELLTVLEDRAKAEDREDFEHLHEVVRNEIQQRRWVLLRALRGEPLNDPEAPDVAAV